MNLNQTAALQALGLTEADLAAVLEPARARVEAFKARVESGELPAFAGSLTLPPASRQAVEGWDKKQSHVVVLGMGGSSLGGRLVAQWADPAQAHSPRMHFVDHLDPVALADLIKVLPVDRTGVIAISKSGGTLETLTQAELVLKAFTDLDAPLGRHWVAVTEPVENPLRTLAQTEFFPVLPHDPALGGRYSVFAETGTLPGLIKGVDIGAFHLGAQGVLNAWLENPFTSAPALGAALHVAAKAKGKTIAVVYAYGERYRVLPAWFEQLWAESLGKSGQGTTPLGASGPASQHSIQQMFLDGPADKLFTLIVPQSHGQGPARADGVTVGTLQQAFAEGTAAAFAARNLPTRTLSVDDTSASDLGATLMHFMLETVLAAQIWGVDPFSQPAVEESKKTSLAALAALTQPAA